MADSTFFDLFERPWAKNGNIDDITTAQYETGWAFIGSLPPTVEQFNRVHQLADQRLMWLYQQVKAVADATGQQVSADTLNILLHALQNLDVDNATAGTLAVGRGGTGLDSIGANQILVGGANGQFVRMAPDEVRTLLVAPKVVSIAALPTQNIGPVVVAECSEVWIWSATAYYTGYRSPLCGRPLDGHTAAPLPSEVDAVGGVLPKASYARLWAYAQENGLVVSQATWSANLGAHYFVDVDANTFRVPDLRNMFRRYTGTDADTANARALGSRQMHAFETHRHTFAITPGGWTGGQGGSNGFMIMGTGTGAITDATGGAETRPMNAAYHPRIHA